MSKKLFYYEGRAKIEQKSSLVSISLNPQDVELQAAIDFLEVKAGKDFTYY